MKRICTILLTLALVALVSSCGGNTGGSETGNPIDTSLRTFMGDLPQNQTSAIKGTNLSCAADAIAAVDSVGTAVSSDVLADCSFEMRLPTGRAYSVILFNGGINTVSFAFVNGTGRLPSPVMYVSAGDLPIDVGNVTIAGGSATVAREPSEQNDRDSDSVADYDDPDDDNDGIIDEEEQNCDLDDFIDDDDEASPCTGAAAAGTPQVLEVRPVNNEGIDEGTESVALDEPVEVRFSCAVDPASVNASTFRVASDQGEIACTYETSDSGEQITCKHESREFAPVARYTATIDGIRCIGSDLLPTVSWSWMTSDGQ